MADGLLWAYCVTRANDELRGELVGVADAPVDLIEADGLAALVGRVPASEFSAQPLRRNLNDLPWLERVARAHEAVLEGAMAVATIVPLRICTLYEREDGVRRMLAEERNVLTGALDVLAGRQEWGVKLLVDHERLVEAAHRRTGRAGDDLVGRGEGAAYLMRRRVEREVRDATHAVATDVARQVHARFQSWARAAVTLPAQNRELSDYEGEMLLNAAYLVEDDRVAALPTLASELEVRHDPLGARIELTGPWPPYNFVPGGEA